MPGTTKMCVILPVHKPVLTDDEALSLRACKAHLSGYDCYLVYPDGLNISRYLVQHPGLMLMPVKKEWLSSVVSYNKMKVSLEFYELFKHYEYMLTYELDAYIFSSNLEEANAFKFDYIGAPFFEGYWDAKPGAKLIKGGNSGFSVRNISACMNALQKIAKKSKWKWFLYKLTLIRSSRVRNWLNKLTGGKLEVYVTGRFAFNFEHFHLNEDIIWSEVVPQLVPSFTVADGASALAFSFEYNLNDSLKLNQDKLPLGCHAWAKHPEFWDKYIDRTPQEKGATDEV